MVRCCSCDLFRRNLHFNSFILSSNLIAKFQILTFNIFTTKSIFLILESVISWKTTIPYRGVWAPTSTTSWLMNFFLPLLFVYIFYILSNFDWICCNRAEGVCLSVIVIYTAQTDEPILMKLSKHHLLYICFVNFPRIMTIQSWWRHDGNFVKFGLGTLTVAFAPIFFKFEDVKKVRLPVFSIWNQQNRLITFEVIANRV